MRTAVISVWIFINLLFFGMCGYMYLLWSQYWIFSFKESEPSLNIYDQQINNYNRGHTQLNTTKLQNQETIRIKHSTKHQNITYVKNSKPRFPGLQTDHFPIDSSKYRCSNNDSEYDCNAKTLEYKDKLLKELRRVFGEEGDVFKSVADNHYNINYEGASFVEKNREELLCELKKVDVRSIKKVEVNDKFEEIRDVMPRKKVFQDKNFGSCAVVTSAGALRNSSLGQIIDSHDVVLRFNNAPTSGYEKDVGSKTTIRVLNSQVVSKDEFDFLQSNLYRNLTLLAWDPSNYTSTLDEWMDSPEFDLFSNFVKYRKTVRKSKFFLLHPRSVWKVWEFLQRNSPGRLRRNPPSSGFLGITLLLSFCDYVDVFEYVPSTRVSKRCHYYDIEVNPSCTFGVWHPLAAEKLFTYSLNTADDKTVFQSGYIRIKGFKKLDNC